MVHRSQGLCLDEMAFDSSGINKYGLTYTMLSRIRTKSILVHPLANSNFQIDKSVSIEMERLTSSAKWKLLVPINKYIHHSHVIIQSINIDFLSRHHLSIQNDHNLQSSHILCFQKTRIKYFEEVSQFINLIKYKYIHDFDGHGLVLLYDKNMICSSTTINHHSGSEFIATTFNEGHRNAIHLIMLYRFHVTSIFSFINTLEQILCTIPLACLIVILGDFNMDFDKEVDKYKGLQILHACMSKYHFK